MGVLIIRFSNMEALKVENVKAIYTPTYLYNDDKLYIHTH